jgi:pimeloyl-ACP methyl ester carboxylesterase
VPQISVGTIRIVIVTIAFALLSGHGAALLHADVPIIRAVDIGHGITLHYVDVGKGMPVVFVHGSLSDGGYWADQIGPFAEHYRTIAYSRRYNYPNTNPARSGYSAVVDADDLAGFIQALHLGKVVVIGHSYGALTALFLAVKHPELVRALVLAEPPAVSLLAHLPDDTGKAMFEDIQRRMVAPMQQAFRGGDRDAGVAAFIDYVFNDPHAWDKMSESSRQETLRNAHEWDVMMTTGILFPDISPPTIRKITTPVLLLSGAKSYPFLGLITEELARQLPNRETIVLPGAGHQMWYQAPEVCRKDVEAFLVHIGIQPSAASGVNASGRLLAVGRQSLPWDYFRFVRDPPSIGNDDISGLPPNRPAAMNRPQDQDAAPRQVDSTRILSSARGRHREMHNTGIRRGRPRSALSNDHKVITNARRSSGRHG